VIEASAGASDTAEAIAARMVFDTLIDPGLATLGATDGVVTIHDVEHLAAYLDLDSSALPGDAVSFVEDGDLVAPWSITRRIVTRAAARDPDALLRHVEREEADHRREAVHGRT
jgi:hypothetical protein